MMTSKLVLLLGTSAAGKTTLGELAAKDPSVTYVNATAAKLELVGPDERLNLLDQQRSYEVNAEFFSALVPANGAVLVDSHATYPVGTGFVRLTPPHICARVSGIVHLDADAETIRRRRVERGRSLEATDLESITHELVAERDEVERIVDRHHVPLCTLDSRLVQVDAAASAVISFVSKLAGRETEAP
jgi:adenylate kinase